MFRLGFDRRWVLWIMECVRSVSFAMLINNEPSHQFFLSRDIGQGDPLFLYLFILFVEAVTLSLHETEWCKDIFGIRICQGSLALTHLFFVDDSLMFCKAMEVECRKVLLILNLYEATSGQKSNVFFNRSTRGDVRGCIQ